MSPEGDPHTPFGGLVKGRAFETKANRNKTRNLISMKKAERFCIFVWRIRPKEENKGR